MRILADATATLGFAGYVLAVVEVSTDTRLWRRTTISALAFAFMGIFLFIADNPLRRLNPVLLIGLSVVLAASIAWRTVRTIKRLVKMSSLRAVDPIEQEINEIEGAPAPSGGPLSSSILDETL